MIAKRPLANHYQVKKCYQENHMTLQAMIEEYRALGRALHQMPPADRSGYPLCLKRDALRSLIQVTFATSGV